MAKTVAYGGLLGDIQHRICLARGYRFKNETAFIIKLRQTLAELAARNRNGLVFINPGAILALIHRVHNIKRSRKTLYYALLYLERRGEIWCNFIRMRDPSGKFTRIVYVVNIKHKLWRKLAGLGKWIRKLAKRVGYVGSQLSLYEDKERINEKVEKDKADGGGGIGDFKVRKRIWEELFGIDVEKELRKKAFNKGKKY